MKNSLFITRFLFTGLAVSMLLLSPFILDLALVPRFISLSVVITLTLVFLYRGRYINGFKIDLISGTYFLYVFFCFLSIAWAINKSEAIFEASRTTLTFFVFVSTYTVLKMQKRAFVELLQKFAVLVVFILFAIAFYQVLEINTLAKEAAYEVTGINGHKNLAASFLFLNMFFVVGAYRLFKGGWKVASAIALMLTLMLVIFFRTKAVWIACLAGFLVYIALSGGRLSRIKFKGNFYALLIVAVLIVNLFFLFLLPLLVQSMLSNNPEMFDEERLMIWNKTYELFQKYPLLGTGAGNWQINHPDATLSGLYRAEDLNYTFQRPHNDFLWVLSETGLIGFNLFVIFLSALIICLLRVLRRSINDMEHQKESVMCLSFIVGYLCISFFDFPKERIEHNILISLILGISYQHIKEYTQPATIQSYQLNRPGFGVLCSLFLFIIAVGVLRFRGEVYTRQMYDYRNAGTQTQTLRSGKLAMSFAYTIDPTSLPVYWYMGNAEAKLNNFPGALSYFQKAFQMNPYNRNVVNDLASAYSTMNNNALAKKYYLEAIRISPRFDDPKLNLVAIYIQEKQYTLADDRIKTLFHDSERRTQYQKIINALK